MKPLERLIFGQTSFGDGEEHLEFQFKFLSAVMVGGALLTALIILTSELGVNAINGYHRIAMRVFTTLAIVLWLLLRGRKAWFLPIAWAYEALCIAEFLSATLFVPFDELRVFWFAINVPGVFILVGNTPGWIITLLSVALVVVTNSYSETPYSIHAMVTFSLGMVYFALFFHFYSARSISYFTHMRESNERLAYMTSHDALTGVLNARIYYDTCNRMISGAVRSGTPFAVLFLDLDHFKSINDTHGHSAGDLVLKAVAQGLASSIRQSDVLARIGGEEFSIFLPNTGLDAAQEVAEKLRQMIETLQIVIDGNLLRVTASLGVAEHRNGEVSMLEIQQQADQAMYEAKAKGRNRVSAFADIC